jgi:hypothetical protein
MGEIVRFLAIGVAIVVRSTLRGMENVPHVFKSIDTPIVVHFKLCGIL